MAISSIFGPKHKALRPIQRERYNDDRDAARDLAMHVRATNNRRGPEAPRGPSVRAGNLEGRKVRRGLSGGSFEPGNNSAFI